MVRLKQIWGRRCLRPAVQGKKKSLRLRHTLGPYCGLNQSEIVKGGPPPSDWPWSRYSCTCVYVWKCVCCCSQTEREVSSKDACSVANLATFQTPLATFFPKKRLMTNLATSWTNFNESMWYSVRSRGYCRNGARSACMQLFRDFSDPLSDFFFSPKKTTSDKSSNFLDKSSRTQLILCICSFQWASERSSTFS